MTQSELESTMQAGVPPASDLAVLKLAADYFIYSERRHIQALSRMMLAILARLDDIEARLNNLEYGIEPE